MSSLQSCLFGIIPSQTRADTPGSLPESTIQNVFLASFYVFLIRSADKQAVPKVLHEVRKRQPTSPNTWKSAAIPTTTGNDAKVVTRTVPCAMRSPALARVAAM